MIGSPYKYMKLGIVHFMAYPEVMKGEGPVLETLTKIAQDDFFSAVEVTLIKDSAQRERARDLLAAAHLTAAYGAQPRLLINKLDLNSLIEDERKKAVAEVQEAIDEAAYLGAKGVAVLSGPGPADKSKKDQALAALVDSLKELSSAAGDKGLNFVLESFDDEIDKKCLIGPVEDAVAVARKVREEHKNFGLMLDLSHLPLQNADVSTTLEKAKEFLVHAHLGNCIMKDPGHPGYGDQHPRFGIPGGENGTEQLREFLQGLFDIGFLGGRQDQPIVSFEVKPLPGESPGIVIANAKRVFKQAWAQLSVE